MGHGRSLLLHCARIAWNTTASDSLMAASKHPDRKLIHCFVKLSIAA